MSMWKTSLTCLAMIALTLFAGSLWAQAPMPATPSGGESSITGTVVSGSDSSVVVETAKGIEMTFVIDSETTLPTTLTAGSRIDVTYVALADGSYRASQIRSVVESPASAAPASTPATAPDPTAAQHEGEALPQTASSRPLMVLVGTLTLIIGTAAWILSRRHA